MENLGIKPGSRVRFALTRVICPSSEDVFKHIESELEVEGEVTLLSDSGKLRQHFAIVQVKGIHVCLIVPVKALQTAVGDEKEYSRTIPVIENDKLAG